MDSSTQYHRAEHYVKPREKAERVVARLLSNGNSLGQVEDMWLGWGCRGVAPEHDDYWSSIGQIIREKQALAQVDWTEAV